MATTASTLILALTAAAAILVTADATPIDLLQFIVPTPNDPSPSPSKPHPLKLVHGDPHTALLHNEPNSIFSLINGGSGSNSGGGGTTGTTDDDDCE